MVQHFPTALIYPRPIIEKRWSMAVKRKPLCTHHLGHENQFV